jgi:glycosyltransferase involved in cell wall biosynthesis
MSMRIMIIKSAQWTYQSYLKSVHPEYTAIRNLVSQNPEHDFVLIGHGLKYEHFRCGRILFYNLGSGNKFRYLFSFLLNFWVPFFLRPSVIVCMTQFDIVPVTLAALVIRAKVIPVVVCDLWYSLPQQRIVHTLAKSFLKASYEMSFAILSLSKNIRDELENDYGIEAEKIFIYKYKISDIFNPHISTNLKETLNPHGPVVLTVGRISPQKGLHYLVMAAPEIIKKIPNVKFVIRSYAAEEKYGEYLSELIKKSNLEEYFKIILKFSLYEEIPKYMGAADVFVLPSVSEGLGVVLLEAMACGVPIIASNIGGAPDIISDGHNGLLFKSGDVNGLSEAIIKILIDKALAKRFSEEALLTVHKNNSNEFETLLKKLIFEDNAPTLSSQRI